MSYITKEKTPLQYASDVLRSVENGTIFINVPELPGALSTLRVFEEQGKIYAELSGMAPIPTGAVIRLASYHLGYLTDAAVQLLQPCNHAPKPARFMLAAPEISRTTDE